MALIKCPECDNKVSDMAYSCPKCGYELKKKSSNNFNIDKNKGNLKYYFLVGIILGAVLIFGIFTKQNNSNNRQQDNNQQNNYQQNTGQNDGITQSQNSGYSIYISNSLGLAFEFPNNYKAMVDSDGLIYVGKNIDDQGALIPYIIVGKYEKFNNAVQFLNSFTDYMRKDYSDLVITIDLLSGTVGDKLVYGIAYNYSSSGHLVVDNRYATVINNVVYMIASREENVNSTEINNVARHIIETLTVGGA